MKSTVYRICTIFLSSIVFTFLFANLSHTESSVNSAKIIANELITLDTRQGVTQKFILIKPENPIAAVILLDGEGDYKMGTSSGKPHIGHGENGTLIRTRDMYAKAGLMVAAMDKPSDHKPPPKFPLGITPAFRMSSEHVQDIKAVMSYLKQEADVPVWLVGMCMGALSSANGGMNIDEIDGLIFLGSVTTPQPGPYARSYPNGILDLNLGSIKVPTLIIYNKDDECDQTIPSNANKIKEALQNSSIVEVIFLSGGKKPLSEPCASMSYHGFYGIEEQLVSTISNFIKSNSK